MTLNNLILLLALFLAALFFLVGMRFYAIRNLRKDELVSGIVSSKPFFAELSFVKAFLIRTLIVFFVVLNWLFSKISPRLKYALVKPKSYFNRFSSYLYGKRTVDKNGASGYWNTINDFKNDNGKGGK
jgi:hypothetical protein